MCIMTRAVRHPTMDQRVNRPGIKNEPTHIGPPSLQTDRCAGHIHRLHTDARDMPQGITSAAAAGGCRVSSSGSCLRENPTTGSGAARPTCRVDPPHVLVATRKWKSARTTPPASDAPPSLPRHSFAVTILFFLVWPPTLPRYPDSKPLRVIFCIVTEWPTPRPMLRESLRVVMSSIAGVRASTCHFRPSSANNPNSLQTPSRGTFIALSIPNLPGSDSPPAVLRVRRNGEEMPRLAAEQPQGHVRHNMVRRYVPKVLLLRNKEPPLSKTHGKQRLSKQQQHPCRSRRRSAQPKTRRKKPPRPKPPRRSRPTSSRTASSR